MTMTVLIQNKGGVTPKTCSGGQLMIVPYM